MKGNPHAENVASGITGIEGMIGKRELYQRDGLGIILEAQSRMAMAHEQRTATLVHLLSFVPMDEARYAELLHEVGERLGHD